jgi:phospho-N-acetylmuramoyl-pentapeptide-transferase
MLAIMPAGIALFERLGLGKNIRTEWLIGQATEFARLHSKKKGTPTMGGVFIILTVLILIGFSILMQSMSPLFEQYLGWSMDNSLWNRQETYLVVFTLVSVGLIGLIDDYLNIREIGRTKGLSARVKMGLLIIFAIIGAYWFHAKLGFSTVQVPLMGDIDFGYFYVGIFVLILVAGANSVNITDGLDGLAWGLLMFQYAAYGFITYSSGMYILSAFCLIVAGAIMGFLWFNIHPARIFMGDVGSLSLGATLAVIAMMTDTLLAFIIMSGVFIIETLSVIIQMTSKKLRNGKKVFRIAPYHHHLEAIGWEEETIVMKLWVIGMILAIAGVIVANIGSL